MNEPDWDEGTENAYERHLERLSTGLCSRCKENEALPDDEWCSYCLQEVELSMMELVEDAAA